MEQTSMSLHLRGAEYVMFLRHRGRCDPHLFTGYVPKTQTNVLITRMDIGCLLHRESYDPDKAIANRAFFEQKLVTCAANRAHIESQGTHISYRYMGLFARAASQDTTWTATLAGIAAFFEKVRGYITHNGYYVADTIECARAHQLTFEMELGYRQQLDSIAYSQAARKRVVVILNDELARVEDIRKHAGGAHSLARHVKHYSAAAYGYYYTMVDMLDKSLYDYMVDLHEPRTSDSVLAVSKMLLQAAAYCHANGMFCLDMDARTIGVKVNAAGAITRVVLGDIYGKKHSNLLADTADSNSEIGHVSYRAIELLLRSVALCVRTMLMADGASLTGIFTDDVLMNQQVTGAVDSWACGVLIMQMVHSRESRLLTCLPLENVHPVNVLRQVFELFGQTLAWDEGDSIIEQINAVSFGMIPTNDVSAQPLFGGDVIPGELTDLVSVMRDLLTYNPDKRMTVSRALAKIQ